MYERGLRQVGEGAWAFLQPNWGWSWANAGVVTGAGQTLLVDTFMDLRLTRELLGAVKAVAPGPIETLVNTHHNPDHVWGNQLVGARRIVAHRRAAEQLAQSPPPEFLAGLLSSPGDEGALGYLKRAFSAFDLSGIVVTPPNEVFDDELAIDVGGREVRLAYYGPCHTLGDIAVHVPEADLVFCGDLLFLRSTPLLWEGSLANWVRTLDRLLGLDARTYVPGHGPVCGPEGLREMRGYLELVITEGTKAFEAGVEPLEAAAGIDLGPYRDWVDAERLVLNFMRLYLELGGEPPETPISPFEAFGAMATLADRWSA